MGAHGTWKSPDVLSERGGRVLDAVMLWFFGPLVALFFLGLAADELPAAVDAARGEGQAGTFIAQNELCSRSCSWTGRYVSADGSLELENVGLDSEVPDAVGAHVPVLYEGGPDPASVYLAEGSREWTVFASFAVVSFAYLTWCAWMLTHWAQGLAHRARDRARPQPRTLPSGLTDALDPRPDGSRGGTEEVPEGAAGAGDPVGGCHASRS